MTINRHFSLPQEAEESTALPPFCGRKAHIGVQKVYSIFASLAKRQWIGTFRCLRRLKKKHRPAALLRRLVGAANEQNIPAAIEK